MIPQLRAAAKGTRSTYMLVLAVDVSQSAANPTISNPVDSWLKYRGCPVQQ